MFAHNYALNKLLYYSEEFGCSQNQHFVHFEHFVKQNFLMIISNK